MVSTNDTNKSAISNSSILLYTNANFQKADNREARYLGGTTAPGCFYDYHPIATIVDTMES